MKALLQPNVLHGIQTHTQLNNITLSHRHSLTQKPPREGGSTGRTNRDRQRLGHKIGRLGAKPSCRGNPNHLHRHTASSTRPVVTVQLPNGLFFQKGKKKKEGFSVSNPVAAVLPIGSVNHFLLADLHHFSFRNGTFLLCGFAVYTHFATLCQHLLMNKYVTGLLSARPWWRQAGQFNPANGLIPALILLPVRQSSLQSLIPWMGRNKGYQGMGPDITRF